MPLHLNAWRRREALAALAGLAGPPALRAAEAPLPVFDAHLHYSHDAWERIPPKEAVALMRQAGLRRAMVSSSSDEGTQKLHAEAPDLVLPVLRPYRTRGEIGSWMHDGSILTHLEQRLARYRYVAVGEYHIYGADADLPVVRRVVQLAREHGLFLHSHSDAEAITRQFRQDPQARVLWAHAGFDAPDKVRDMLRQHPRLWCDLAFRSDHASAGKVDAAWREVFLAHPDRFLLGTDTFTPERWYYVPEHARWSRQWLADLPAEVADRIAWRNGETLFTALAQQPDCPAPAPGAQLLREGGVQLQWRAQPAIAVGRPFALEITLCPATAELRRVDASMPEHRHGMNYRPSLTPLGAGRWRAEGLLWHMSGRWELRLDLVHNGQALQLRQSVALP